MSEPNLTEPSKEAIAVLRLLKLHHNVLISGAPGTGKSRLLAEVKHLFKQVPSAAFLANGPNAFPPEGGSDGIEEWLPSPEKTDRMVWSTTFHQGTKYRDFVSGFTPKVSEGQAGFATTLGPLFLAAEHGRKTNGASLLEVDEINRGPAVAIFGDTITAIESDKRLRPDGSESPVTANFRAIDANGQMREFYLPYHLYILASMNQADTSVEPLDVAFLRRFTPFKLNPSESQLRTYLDLGQKTEIPEKPSEPLHAFEAAVQAWSKVNERISLARGEEFELGHGVFMDLEQTDLPQDTASALEYVADVWKKIAAHIGEVLFGDIRGIAAVLQAGNAGSPYSMRETFFADSPVYRIEGPRIINAEVIYPILRAVAHGD